MKTRIVGTMDDPVAALIAKCAAADRAAFRALYRDTSAKLMGVLLRMLRERAEAEDALQEVYTRVWLRAGRYDPAKGRGMTWLIAIARNLAIDRLRARPVNHSDDGLDMVQDSAPRAETRLVAQGEARRMADCFNTLEPDRADAVKGAYLNGLSYLDLAARHAVPLNTMRTWLRRSLLKLKECLET
ncbi:sigma-70 family RNA polymerase sigma factor [Tabrizicola sp.]|uniref:sigma-70 family RNA polymerase sigma factor n=1 Tax=Tabrizicola sp. TaxID=2005166 RepID=UPI003BAFA6C6